MNPASVLSKQVNTRNIVNFMIINGEVTRPLIASSLNLSTATVTNIVTELINRDIVLEGRKDSAAVGRKATFLRFNNKLFLIVTVILIHPDIIRMAVCDLAGEPICTHSTVFPLMIDDSNTDIMVFKGISSAICDFISNQDEGIRNNIMAVGISIPGIVLNSSTIYAPFFNWKNMPLGNYLRMALKYPVFLENVTRIKSIYEMRYVDENDRNVLYLALSPGIGLVHFFNGKMIMGKTGISGEVGHMTLNVDGPECYCGNNGCFEIYCGENYIVKKAKELLEGVDRCEILRSLVKDKKYPLSIETLFEARNLGSIKVHHLLTIAAEYLGSALVNLYNLYDPDRIIISGTIVETDKYVLDLAVAGAKSKVLNRFSRNISLSMAKLKTCEHEKAICANVLNQTLDKIIN